MISKCTVLFEDPFWIAVFEKWCDEHYQVAKVVIGKEPKSTEVYEWILLNYSKLCFRTAQQQEEQMIKKISRKKLTKTISREVNGKYAGTKAQQTLKELYTTEKEVHKKQTKIEKEEEFERKFSLKQEKKKQKHRGH